MTVALCSELLHDFVIYVKYIERALQFAVLTVMTCCSLPVSQGERDFILSFFWLYREYGDQIYDGWCAPERNRIG